MSEVKCCQKMARTERSVVTRNVQREVFSGTSEAKSPRLILIKGQVLIKVKSSRAAGMVVEERSLLTKRTTCFYLAKS